MRHRPGPLGRLRTPGGREGENAGRYSNPAADAAFFRAGALLRRQERLGTLREGMRLLLADVPAVPLYVEHRVYALRRSFRWTPRQDKVVRVHAFDVAQ